MENTSTLPSNRPEAGAHTVTMTDIATLGARLDTLVNSVRRVIFQPEGNKPSPTFNLAQLAALCSKTSDQMSRLIEKTTAKEKVSADPAASPNRKRLFSLGEARAWIRKVGPKLTRPEGLPGAVITVANFKGGVGKTIVTMSLAQGLSLRGYKVLCIDFDPQGSLTSLFGLSPSDISEDETVLPLMLPRTLPNARETLQASIRSTYWDGVDLVPGSYSLFGGEFYLPMRQMESAKANAREPGFQFYRVLQDALELGILDEYDYVLIDTPPALSYMTMTCFWASNALLLPLPPEGLDFASSAQFWNMLDELSSADESQSSKEFSWVGVVPSKVDQTKIHTKEIMSWMKDGYQGMLLSTEIPETAAVRVGGMKLETVYDINRYVGAQKTLLRARDAYDKLVDEVDFLTRRNHWKIQA